MLIIDSTALRGLSSRRKFHTSCSLVFIRSGEWVEVVTMFIGGCSWLLPVRNYIKNERKSDLRRKFSPRSYSFHLKAALVMFR
jgi:hypothetical protein